MAHNNDPTLEASYARDKTILLVAGISAAVLVLSVWIAGYLSPDQTCLRDIRTDDPVENCAKWLGGGYWYSQIRTGGIQVR